MRGKRATVKKQQLSHCRRMQTVPSPHCTPEIIRQSDNAAGGTVENKLIFIQRIPVHPEEHNRSDLSFSPGDSTEISVTFHLTINFFSKMSETLLRREKIVFFFLLLVYKHKNIHIHIYPAGRSKQTMVFLLRDDKE